MNEMDGSLEIFRTNGKKNIILRVVKLCQTVSFAGTIKHDGKKLALGLKKGILTEISL